MSEKSQFEEEADGPDQGEEELSADLEDLVESNPVVKVLSRPGSIRIVKTLVDAGGADLPVADIADQAGIDKQTFYNNEDLLIKYDLIEQSNKIGNAKLYRAKMESEPIQGFIHIYDALLGACE